VTAEKYFTVRAELGDAKFAMAVRSDCVDQIIEEWERTVRAVATSDFRGETRQLVGDILMRETQNQPEESLFIAKALVWLAATGGYGEKLVPLMRAGDMEFGYTITRIDATNFNYRQTVDEKTGAYLGLGRSQGDMVSP